MELFLKAVRRLIVLLCAALFLVGAVWNLFCTPHLQERSDSAVSNTQLQPGLYADTTPAPITVAQDMAADDMGNDTSVLFELEYTQQKEQQRQQAEQESLAKEQENRIAALRMERDASWQQLYTAVEQLEFAEKQQTLQQYAQLQYKEQRLELLLSARGIGNCLVVLEEQQANVIVPEDVLQNQYEKIYDLVKRNAGYADTQIILVPLQM